MRGQLCIAHNQVQHPQGEEVIAPTPANSSKITSSIHMCHLVQCRQASATVRCVNIVSLTDLRMRTTTTWQAQATCASEIWVQQQTCGAHRLFRRVWHIALQCAGRWIRGLLSFGLALRIMFGSSWRLLTFVQGFERPVLAALASRDCCRLHDLHQNGSEQLRLQFVSLALHFTLPLPVQERASAHVHTHSGVNSLVRELYSIDQGGGADKAGSLEPG